jgi:hypothetical protein
MSNPTRKPERDEPFHVGDFTARSYAESDAENSLAIPEKLGCGGTTLSIGSSSSPAQRAVVAFAGYSDAGPSKPRPLRCTIREGRGTASSPASNLAEGIKGECDVIAAVPLATPHEYGLKIKDF